MRLLLALAVCSAGCLDLDHLMHLHDLGEDAGVEDLSGVDQAAGSFTWSAPIAGLAGPANAVHVVNGVTYLATPHGGIWSSPDATSWSYLSSTLALHDISDVAVNGASIYASTLANGTWKSSDGGATWASLAGSPSPNVLALSPSGPTSEVVYAGTAGGVVVSTDSGATWELLKGTGDMGTAAPTSVHALVLVPGASQAEDVLYAGGANGPFVYANGGWESVSTGVVPKPVVAIAVADGELYVGTSTTSAGVTTGGLYKAPRTGPFVFSPITPTLPPAGIQALAYVATTYDAGTGGTVFATSTGVARYAIDTVTGTMKSSTTVDDRAVTSLAVDPSGTLYAAGGFGFAIATTAAPTLTAQTTGLHNTQITTITDDTSNTPVLLAGSIIGAVVRTSNAGGTWSTQDTGLAAIGTIHVLATAPITDTRAYVGADTGLFTTTTTGSPWSMVGTAGAPPTGPVTAFASNPTAENTIYAASPDGVHKSTDGGTSWTLLADSPTSATAILVTKNALYVAGTSSPGDGGAALPVLVRSTDGGTTFELANDGLPGVAVSQLLATGATTDTVYAATSTDGIYRSADGATTWQTSNQGLGNTTVRGIAFSPAAPLLMYAATSTGVFASTDGGAIWSNVTKNLGNTDVEAIAVSGSVVLVGTNGDGVFLGQ